jgi:hypothetical protein
MVGRRRSLGYSRKKQIYNESKLLSELQKYLTDLNSPQLLIHNSYGGLTKLSIYS